MNVCIVGHHKNPEGRGLGEKIDSFDAVIRMKMGYKLCTSNPMDYGTRTDFLCTSTETLGTLSSIGCEEYWGYPKYGYYDENVVEKCAETLDAGLFIDLNGCNLWNKIFREIGGKHPNVSLGMACIVITARRLVPAHIYLIGMDTLLRPELGIDRVTTVNRTGVGAFPNHDWEAENKLLKMMKIPFSEL